MSEFELRAMEEGSDSWMCPGNKKRGGITVRKSNWGPVGAIVGIIEDGGFDFSFECICAMDAFIPLPVAALGKAAVSRIMQARGVKNLLSYLRVGRPLLNSKFKDAARIVMRSKLAKATLDKGVAAAEYAAHRSKFLDLGQRIVDAKSSLNDVNAAITGIRKTAAKYVDRMNNLGCDKINSIEIWKLIANGSSAGFIPDGTSPTVFKSCLRLASILVRNGEPAMRPLLEQQETLKNLIKELMPEFERIRGLRDAAKKAEKDLLDLQKQLDILESEAPVNQIDNLSPESQSSLTASAFEALLIVLEALSIVQEKNCLSNQSGLAEGTVGAALNQETCMCSECPSGYKQLCDLNSWIRFLPSALGTRQADELNVCMQCCDNALPSPKLFRGNFITYSLDELFGEKPCSCECFSGYVEGSGGWDREWVDCNGPNTCDRGTIFSRPMVCRKKDYQIPTNYEWDPESCDYKCKSQNQCGSECCENIQSCVDGSSGNKCCCPDSMYYCQGDGTCTECPPGYTTINSPTGMLGIQQTECVENCLADSSICGTDCCEFSYLASTPSGPAPIGTCLPCPDKTRTLRFDDQYAESAMNPWKSRMNLVDSIAVEFSADGTDENKYVCDFTYNQITGATTWDCNLSPDAGVLYQGMSLSQCQEEIRKAEVGLPSGCGTPKGTGGIWN